ncbi:sensor histidine kinase [Terrabacter carboxydivorans]|uniref:sensor histidine kinase n=1 Tax=Terrabacter carboxydivorans TaxID=619730 RepID=UPI0031E0DCA3
MDPQPPEAPRAVGGRDHHDLPDLPPWWTLADGVTPAPVRPLPSRRRTVVQLGIAALAVFVAVVVGASFAASRLAEREAVNDAAHTTNLLALAVVQPVLQDALLTGDAAAYDALDRVVRERVLPNGIVRVKLWAPDGRVVYADETRLVGQQFTLGDEQRATLAQPRTRAEVSDLASSENEFERYGGKLLEVYRPVWTPSGAELLFEVYGDYEPVSARAFDLWRGLAGVLASSLLLLLVLMAPIIWRLLDRLGAAQAQRESVLRASVEASARERRRIAADLHDGPVQDLVASSFAVSGAAESARSDGRPRLAATITEAASTVRASVASLRSLLVDIYPERLADAGLAAAVADLARPLAGRGIDVVVDVDETQAARLGEAAQQVAHRVARECLRNVVRHADARHVVIRLAAADAVEARDARDAGAAGATGATGDGLDTACSDAPWATGSADRGDPRRPVVLSVTDDGVGFDPARLPRVEGHFGVRVLADLATDVGAVLRVRSAPGRGTQWQLALPVEEDR